MLCSTITTPLYGKLSDSYGRRAMFGVSIAIFLLGSVLCGAARTMDAAHRLPRRAGPGRRRPAGTGPGHDRRCRLPARARHATRACSPPPSASPASPVRLLGGIITAASLLALDLLRQPADRHPRPHHDPARPAPSRHRPTLRPGPPHRLSRRRSAHRPHHQRCCSCSPGAAPSSPGSPPTASACSLLTLAFLLLFTLARGARLRADHPPRFVPEPRLCARLRGRRHDDVRHVGRPGLPAALFPARPRHEPDSLRRDDPAAGRLHAALLDPRRPDRQPLRALPALPAGRHRFRDPRPRHARLPGHLSPPRHFSS